MMLGGELDHASLSEVLNAVRTPYGDEETQLSRYRALDLRVLNGGRNNAVFAWNALGREVCIKLYTKTDRRRAERERHGLAHVAKLRCAPRPLSFFEHTELPALVMTLLPGSPILDAQTPAATVAAVATTTRAIQSLPLTGPLASLERIDSIRHHCARLTDIWPAQLAEAAEDPLTSDMLALLQQWEIGGDADTLARPAGAVLSRGDMNLLNWLDHDGQTLVVDFEYSGFSDVAVDAADHVEHISARAIPDHVWTSAEADFGIDRTNRTRFAAARRTIALRWLAVLWRRRHQRAVEFAMQHDRVRALFE